MQEVQLQYGGMSYRGGILCDEADWLEICLFQPAFFRCGDEVTIRSFNRKHTMRVIQTEKAKVTLIPADSDLFKIYTDQFNEDALDSGEVCASYKINAFATIARERKPQPVRVVDVSRLGIGFVTNDLSVQFHTLYNATIALGRIVVAPTLVVKYAHFMEKGIRYSAEIRWISQHDLQELRYFLACRLRRQFSVV
ncbi:hypothetical protein [Paenibacillus hamazuiensis]|uniref:hypothetical protein n=1 Tax=Paenibacillus hamazuiensis TaxID=2936508 RepID=UPI00200F03AB|nr:hypothetical protein [Paenibacillus hamazuiensis]